MRMSSPAAERQAVYPAGRAPRFDYRDTPPARQQIAGVRRPAPPLSYSRAAGPVAPSVAAVAADRAAARVAAPVLRVARAPAQLSAVSCAPAMPPARDSVSRRA